MIRNLIRSLIRRGYRPGPRVEAQMQAEMQAYYHVQETPALTVEETIRSLREQGLSYRAIQAQTGSTYHKVRQVCLSA